MSKRFDCKVLDELGQQFRVVAKPADENATDFYFEYRRDEYAHESHSIAVVLPASDARRLRDWLRERYPETDTGETT